MGEYFNGVMVRQEKVPSRLGVWRLGQWEVSVKDDRVAKLFPCKALFCVCGEQCRLFGDSWLEFYVVVPEMTELSSWS